MTPARPFLLPVGSRSLFALHHAPPADARGAAVYVPPFAEEMNKSRRMVALQCRALAEAGWHVLQVDLCGTGDSEGDFADATWEGWLADVDAARVWLAARAGIEPWLWGLRLGGLLAAAAAAARPAPGLLLWQPVASGRQHLQQFLRLKAGAEWLSAGREQQAVAQPMQQLEAGAPVEVAGYTLHPGLALPLARSALVLPTAPARVAWLEVTPRVPAELSPAAQRALAPLGHRAHARAVQGPSFWQAQEIETAPALLQATLEALVA